MNCSIFLLFFLGFTSGQQQILQFTELLLAFCTSGSPSVCPPYPLHTNTHTHTQHTHPTSTQCKRSPARLHLPPKEILWASAARGSWGSGCVCYYPICMTILQLQVLPEDANKNRVPQHSAFESKLSPFSYTAGPLQAHTKPWPELMRETSSFTCRNL